MKWGYGEVTVESLDVAKAIEVGDLIFFPCLISPAEGRYLTIPEMSYGKSKDGRVVAIQHYAEIVQVYKEVS